MRSVPIFVVLTLIFQVNVMNIFKKLLSVLVTAVILLTLSACGKSEPASSAVKKGNGAAAVSADTDNRALYVSKDKSKLSLIAKSDMIELYFDRENCTVSVYDTASDKLWSSLPEKNAGEKTSAVSLTVLVNGSSYTLSSQSDSVGFSSALYEEKENGVTVNYGFKRTLEDGTKINLFLPVSYTLADGALTVEADCSNIAGEGHDSDVPVTHIGILPFFGSDSKGAEGDYMLIPDGCGATVDTSVSPEAFENISLPVYEEGNLLGVFGKKNADSAYAVLIDEGEELSSVKVQKALSSGGLNRIYADFEITPTHSDEENIYICNDSYKGKIRLVYRFLSYGNADYTGMAVAVREMLIRKGYLLSEREDAEGDYPFNLSVIFQNYVTDARGRTLAQTLTTYAQAQEMLDSLKAKGITNINMRLKGALTDEELAKIDFSSAPGSKKDLEKLISYGESDSVTFYTDASLVTLSEDAGAQKGALTPDGEYLSEAGRTFLSAPLIAENSNALIRFMRKNSVQGVCINDGCKTLYGDCSAEDFSLKTDIADVISGQVASVSALGKLMVDTGNIYGVKYADTIVNLPVTAKVQDRDLCARVPFVQTILHGLADYSCEPVNSFANSEKAFLKCIEFGAVPYYEWYASDLSTQEKTDKSSYLNFITEAQSQYERAAEVFEDLRDARITDHYRVRKNVYYTCYDNSTGIYVNYNDEPVTVNGMTVEAMSFLRVN